MSKRSAWIAGGILTLFAWRLVSLASGPADDAMQARN